MLLPRSLAGGEVDPISFVEVIEEISSHDASTAWSLCQVSGCSMVSAYLDPAVASNIFGNGGVLAWGPGPGARAVVADGGYRVTGRFNFASGGRHATWFGGYCPIYEDDGHPRRRADGTPDGRTMLFPASRATMHDVWHVIGLRGTGSDSFSVQDLHVPQVYSVARDDPSERRHAGLLYCFPSGSLYASGFAGVAMGIARTSLDALIALAQEKTPRGYAHTLRESAVVQSQVAQAEARLGSARTYLLVSLDEIWREVGRVKALSLEQRVRIRLAATYAIHAAKDVVDTVYQAAGATAIFQSNAFERRFRDIHAVTQQLQGRLAHFETVGRYLLGLDPDTAWL
jgi:alkylation response protein AidB-like acyl-CoA dehydrogenase